MFHANDIVYCRFTGEAFRVVYCNGCVVKLDDDTVRTVGELTLFPIDNRSDPDVVRQGNAKFAY